MTLRFLNLAQTHLRSGAFIKVTALRERSPASPERAARRRRPAGLPIALSPDLPQHHQQ
ncbi:hypothetical protein [Marinobacter zhejiangensis]|uniref:Uncharacterized protein n=1 Tax=Marinobacter zhejiangensis TaxID=488535 RepID=A0A1I4T0V8_9GAMM|nr:hypothetical protein [Marinobacter zhejiangensis]SFM70364.1 hypothetical protein SAMN04487963_3430 [Marinobacter zhejiangensis]